MVLSSRLVAVADDRNPRMQVVVHRPDTGVVVCRVELFDDDRSATDSGGWSVDADSLLVLDQHGYDGPLSTALGRTTTSGIARVGVAAGRCRVAWGVRPRRTLRCPAVSAEAGLAYVYTSGTAGWARTRGTTALDLDTGRGQARRTGLGVLADNHHGASRWAPTAQRTSRSSAGSWVRVADRPSPLTGSWISTGRRPRSRAVADARDLSR